MGNYKEALKAASELRDIFGPGNFYVELMDHGLDIENRVKGDLIKLAKELDLPLLDRKSTRLNSSHTDISRMPSSA